ncbi:DUF859 domain-containing protein [Eubacteriales bacterium OttesenSCG-928-M02]|nr:DUF859 domain-containing protein [Eubacteriales bacterium OttesenSCG-928-M02]
MATSSPMNTSNQYIKYTVTVTQNSQNINNNTSNVTVSVRVYRTNTGYTTYGSGTVYCRINGTTYTAGITSSQKITYDGIVLFVQTLDIPHNADGTKLLSTSAWISHSQFTSGEQGYDQWLSTIPRATTPNFSPGSANVGSTITINLPRASGSFTHDITYRIGNLSGAIAYGAGSSTTWTIPTSLANAITNNTTGTVQIVTVTKNGGTTIGSVTSNYSIGVPNTAAYLPTIGSVSISEHVEGIAEKFGAYVQSKSQLQISFTGSGAYSSTITKNQITANAQIFNANTATTSVLSGSGSQNIVLQTTDSRGRSASVTRTVDVLAYQSPLVSEFNAVRCDVNGVEDDNGTYAKVTISAVITPLGDLNEKSFILRYKRAALDTWTTLDITPGSGYSINGDTLVPNIGEDNTWNFQLLVTDYFGTTESIILDVPSSFTLMDWNASGKGMATGKASEIDGVFEIGEKMPLLVHDDAFFVNEVNNTLYDAIIAPLNSLLTTRDISGTWTPEIWTYSSGVKMTVRDASGYYAIIGDSLLIATFNFTTASSNGAAGTQPVMVRGYPEMARAIAAITPLGTYFYRMRTTWVTMFGDINGANGFMLRGSRSAANEAISNLLVQDLVFDATGNTSSIIRGTAVMLLSPR